MKLLVGRAACMARNKLKETTFPSLNQTGESCSLSLNLASSLACVCLPPPPKHQLGMKECLQHVSQVWLSHPWVILCWYVIGALHWSTWHLDFLVILKSHLNRCSLEWECLSKENALVGTKSPWVLFKEKSPGPISENRFAPFCFDWQQTHHFFVVETKN